MPLLLATVLAASSAVVPSCSWDRPGHRAFMGDVVAAVDRYADIPAPVRQQLKRRMAARQFDEIATIERDAIRGRFKYAPEIREMHFAQGQVCAAVTRERWAAADRERGLVYCESGHCVIVPTVCRNVARVTRLSDRVAGEETPGDADAKGVDRVVLPREAAAGNQAPAAGVSAVAARVGSTSFEQIAGVPLQPASETPAVPASLPTLLLDQAPAQVAIAPADTTPIGGGALDPTAPPLAPVLPFATDPGPVLVPGVLLPVTPVPEPSVWVMLLAGLAVMLFLLRRRGGSE